MADTTINNSTPALDVAAAVGTSAVETPSSPAVASPSSPATAAAPAPAPATATASTPSASPESTTPSLSAVSALTASEVTNASVHLSWEAPQGAELCTVQYSTNGFLATWQVAGTTSDASYKIENLSPYTSYLVRVFGTCGTINGPFGEPLRFTTLSDAEWLQKRANSADQYKTALDAATARAAELELSLEEATAARDLLKISAQNADIKLAESQTELSALSARVTTLQTEAQEVAAARDLLKISAQNADIKLAESQTELSTLSARVATLQTEADEAKAARAEVVDCQQQLAAQQAENESVTATLKEVQSKLQELKTAQSSTSADMKDRCARLSAEADALRAEVDEARCNAAQIKSELEEERAQKAEVERAMEAEQADHAARVAELQKVLAEARAQAQTAAQERDANTMVESLRTERAGLRHEVTGLEMQVKSLRNQVTALEEESQPLRRRIAEMATAKDAAERASAQATERVGTLNAELQVAQSELVDSREEERRLASLTAGLNGEIVRLQSRLEDMRAMLDRTEAKQLAAEEQVKLQADHIAAMGSAPTPAAETSGQSSGRVCTLISEAMAYFKGRGKTSDDAVAMALQVPGLLEFGYGVDRVHQALVRFPKTSQMNLQVDFLLGSSSPAPGASDTDRRPPATATWE